MSPACLSFLFVYVHFTGNFGLLLVSSCVLYSNRFLYE